MRKVFIPVFSSSVQSKQFSLQGSNPGVGGTEFTTIRLALSLAASRPDWKVIIASYTGIKIEDNLPNLAQEIYEDVSIFFQSASNIVDNSSVVIATISVLKRANIEFLKKIENHLIAWSRHPFDVEASKLANQINFKGIVCVGIYQFYSNRTISSHVHHIQNIFISPVSHPLKLDKSSNQKTLNIVYLGALIPGKGFLDLAKAWEPLKQKFPGVKLHVIGSSATYGSNPESAEIPASADYAKGILRFIPQHDIRRGDVIFYGNLGEEKFDIIQRCDLAILNPTGATEAFPASPLECMAFGVPVIASDDYGMSDAMRFFPELVIDGHKNIVEKVTWLIADPLRYLEMQHRSITVAKWFDSQTGLIITRWIRLLDAIFMDTSSDFILFPTMPFYGSKPKLLLRRDIRPRLATVKHRILKVLQIFG